MRHGQGRGSKSREERRMEADRARVLITLALAILALLILVWIGEGPIPGERVPEGAAQFAASQEYERALELYGDPATAVQMAERVYGDVLNQWAEGWR